MEEIQSKNGDVIHVVFRKDDLDKKPRWNISPADHALQARTINAPKGEKFRAHKHKLQNRSTTKTQESIIIVEGVLRATLYDTDDSELTTVDLHPGDCYLMYDGGHAFEVVEPVLMYEHKNGPYNGLEMDKEDLDV